MTKRMGKSTLGTVIPAMLILSLASAAFAGEKHFIGHSWDLLKATTDDLIRNLSELEKLPLDGISISLSIKGADGKSSFRRDILSDDRWKKADFSSEIGKVKKISGGKLKHNFLLTNFAPKKRLAWTDDAAWEKAAHNAAVLAWITKTSGAKGIMLDPEDYWRSKQYYHVPGDPSYKETAVLARRRGAQLMKAMAAEHPDIILLSFGFLSGTFKDPDRRSWVEKTGNLRYHFVNGIIDGLPAGARMIDATEGGYVCSAVYNDFPRLAWSINRMARDLIAPENHPKYLRQYELGFGLYLDMYTNPEDREWTHPSTNGSRVKTLYADFSQAMMCADEYCWVYGEKYSWIKWDCAEKMLKGLPRHMKVRPETWEEKLPGFTKNMNFIAKGEKAYQTVYDHLAENGKLANRIRNPKCVPGKNKKTASADRASDWNIGSLPPGWFFWRKNPKLGSFSIDKTVGMGDTFSVKAAGTGGASFILITSVKPGQVYSCEAFKKGNGNARLSIRWQRGKKWLISVKYDEVFSFSGKPNDQGWQRAFGFVKVPQEADKLVLLLGVDLKPDETVWFDNPCISLISPEDLP